MFVIPLVNPSHSFSVGASYGDATTFDGGLSNDTTLVTKLPPGAVSSSGNYLRITLQNLLKSINFDSVWIGHGSPGPVYNFTGDQVQVSFSNYGFADAHKPFLTPDPAEYKSDDITYAFDSGKPLLVAFGYRQGFVQAATTFSAGGNVPSTYVGYYGGVYTAAGDTTKSLGKSKNTRVYLIKSIEVAT